MPQEIEPYLGNPKSGNIHALKSNKEDCWQCRLLSSAGLLGAAAYVFKFLPQQPKFYGRVVIVTVSSGLATLGLSRLFDLPPFRKGREESFTNIHTTEDTVDNMVSVSNK